MRTTRDNVCLFPQVEHITGLWSRLTCHTEVILFLSYLKLVGIYSSNKNIIKHQTPFIFLQNISNFFYIDSAPSKYHWHQITWLMFRSKNMDENTKIHFNSLLWQRSLFRQMSPFSVVFCPTKQSTSHQPLSVHTFAGCLHIIHFFHTTSSSSSSFFLCEFCSSGEICGFLQKTNNTNMFCRKGQGFPAGSSSYH